MISPTGSLEIRNDKLGAGYYGASRKSSTGRKYSHKGVDLVISLGNGVIAPFDGATIRRVRPYEDENYNGILIINHTYECTILYFEPNRLIEEWVQQGQVIGYAQDISKRFERYADMKPHLHIEVVYTHPLGPIGGEQINPMEVMV